MRKTIQSMPKSSHHPASHSNNQVDQTTDARLEQEQTSQKQADQAAVYPQLRLEKQLCFPLYACARAVVNAYTPLLKPLGITYTQYLVFLVLWEHTEISTGELGRRLYLDNGTLSPLLKKMEKSGWIVRRRDDQDERIVRISLTSKGLALREDAASIPSQIAGCLPLDGENASQLYRLLYEILDHKTDAGDVR